MIDARGCRLLPGILCCVCDIWLASQQATGASSATIGLAARAAAAAAKAEDTDELGDEYGLIEDRVEFINSAAAAAEIG